MNSCHFLVFVESKTILLCALAVLYISFKDSVLYFLDFL